MDKQEATAPAGTAPAATGKKQGGLGETTRFLLILFLGALILRSFIFAPYSIPSGSMLPRMMIGDYLLVAKWPYGYSRHSLPFGLGGFDGRLLAGEPERGDVVVFREPGSEEDIVKRLIGRPGDTVQMKGGQLFLNGKAVPKTRIADYLMPQSANSPCRYVSPAVAQAPVVRDDGTFCRYPRFRETVGGRSFEVLDQGVGEADDTEIFRVPEGHYFLMGDNRDDSADSRFAVERNGVGLVPAENLIGRAMIVFFSTDGTAEWLKPWTWFSAARFERVGGTYR